jgi:hypothetical protein
MMRRSKSNRFLFSSFIFFAPCFAVAVLLEVLLPLRFVLGTWDSRVFFMGSSRFCLARSRVHQLRFANSFLVGLVIGLGLAVSSSSHLIFFVLKWAQAH